MTKRKFQTLYDHDPLPGVEFTQPTQTQRHFQSDCDINKIMAKFFRCGQFPHLNAAQPTYGDVSEPFSFRDAQNYIIDAEERFMELPAKIRKRFDNNPARLLDFLGDAENIDEAIRLGLVEAPRTSPLLDVTGTTDTKSEPEPGA